MGEDMAAIMADLATEGLPEGRMEGDTESRVVMLPPEDTQHHPPEPIPNYGAGLSQLTQTAPAKSVYMSYRKLL